MTTVIAAEGLTKTFDVPVRESGVVAATRSLFRRSTRLVTAIRDATFTVGAGELVGVLGPNGAGKTTTIKLLAGLLHATSGTVTVLGSNPAARSHEFLRRISLVTGNRSQLEWDLPPLDSYEMLRSIYRVPRPQYRDTLAELVELFDLDDLLNKPIRTLSLGERMKAEFVGSLLHQPEVLFLDEPTLGLDITMQLRLREFIKRYNADHGATVLLTSHYMADITAIADRVLVITKGSLLFDGPLASFAEQHTPVRTLDVWLREPADLTSFGTVIKVDAGHITLEVPKSATSTVVATILREFDVLDLSISDPPIDDVLAKAFLDAVEREPESDAS